MNQPEQNRILVVDDIEENLKVLSETLVEEGFYPLQAKNGERAIQIAKKAKPDLILLDIKMPDMDGFETIAILKNDPETADIPVIFISALNQIEDKVRGFQAGAVDYVSKPFQKRKSWPRGNAPQTQGGPTRRRARTGKIGTAAPEYPARARGRRAQEHRKQRAPAFSGPSRSCSRILSILPNRRSGSRRKR
jgi:CheY-like chemotaxis protein